MRPLLSIMSWVKTQTPGFVAQSVESSSFPRPPPSHSFSKWLNRAHVTHEIILFLFVHPFIYSCPRKPFYNWHDLWHNKGPSVGFQPWSLQNQVFPSPPFVCEEKYNNKHRLSKTNRSNLISNSCNSLGPICLFPNSSALLLIALLHTGTAGFVFHDAYIFFRVLPSAKMLLLLSQFTYCFWRAISSQSSFPGKRRSCASSISPSKHETQGNNRGRGWRDGEAGESGCSIHPSLM